MAEDGDHPKPHTLASHESPQDFSEMVHQCLHLVLELRDTVARLEGKAKPHLSRGRKR